MNQIPKLRFKTTRDIYQKFKTSNPAINFLIYGLLFWIEDHVVDYKTKTAVDSAIINYEHQREEPETPWKAAVVTEEPNPDGIPLPVLKSSYDWVEKKEDAD